MALRARALLVRELEQAHRQEYEGRARVELRAEYQREPTAAEVAVRYAEILAAAVDAGSEKRYRKEREGYLKLDLEPFEFADLQKRKILILQHEDLEIIKMRNSAGGDIYYRDRPDADRGDNLLRLPRYKSQTIART